MKEVIKVEDCVENIGDFDIPIHNAIIVPTNATNGDMIQAMFPNASYTIGAQFMHIVNVNSVGELSIPLKWVNAPYSAESDEQPHVPLSSVTPKTGRWINGDPICPCCGENKFKDLDADVWSDWQPKFCPNCGANIQVVKE